MPSYVLTETGWEINGKTNWCRRNHGPKTDQHNGLFSKEHMKRFKDNYYRNRHGNLVFDTFSWKQLLNPEWR